MSNDSPSSSSSSKKLSNISPKQNTAYVNNTSVFKSSSSTSPKKRLSPRRIASVHTMNYQYQQNNVSNTSITSTNSNGKNTRHRIIRPKNLKRWIPTSLIDFHLPTNWIGNRFDNLELKELFQKILLKMNQFY